MKITVQNYKQLRNSFDLKKLDKNILDVFKDVDADFNDYLELYVDASPEFDGIRDIIDTHLKLINKYLVEEKKVVKTPAPKQVSKTIKAEFKNKFKKVIDKKLSKIKKPTQKKAKPVAKESPCDDAIADFLDDKKEALEKASKRRKRKNIANSLDVENVNFYNEEFRLLRRFYTMVTKKTTVPLRSVKLLHMAFQKSAIARKVRKTSDLSALFTISSKKLTKLLKSIEEKGKESVNITFADKDVLEQLEKLVANKKVDYAITLLNRVINLQGTAPEDKKVKTLITAIENGITKGRVDERSRLYDDLVKAKSNLKKYLDEEIEIIEAVSYGLSGLKKKVVSVVLDLPETPKPIILDLPSFKPQMLAVPIAAPVLSTGLNAPTLLEKPIERESKIETVVKTVAEIVKDVKKVDGVMSTEDIMNMKFDSLEFEDEWADFMQNPAKNMQLAIWGKPKNGKTAGALSMANMLTKYGSILYNFADQGINKSTQDLWKLSGLSEKTNAHLTDVRELKDLEALCATGNYDYVFIDMINTYISREKIKPHEFEDRFKNKYPEISFILIFEVIKSGDFKGDQGWTHIPDALITVDSFVMHNQGRYGVGEYVVWKEGLQKVNPKKYKEIFSEENTPKEPIILDI